MSDDSDIWFASESSCTIKYAKSQVHLKYDPAKKLHTDLCISVLNNIALHDFIASSVVEERMRNEFALLNIFTGNALKVIRYAKEVITLDSIISVDQSETALALATANINMNNVSPVLKIVHSSCVGYLNTLERPFPVIELDPAKKNCVDLYEPIIKCLSSPALFILNVPELGLVSGNAYHQRCFEIYGGKKMGKHSATVEVGLRLVLKKLCDACQLNGKNMEVLLSFFERGTIRLFIKVFEKSTEASSTLMSCKYCSLCDFYSPDPTEICTKCNVPLLEAGEFWAKPLKNENFVSLLLRTIDIVDQNELFKKLLTIHYEIDVPLCFNPNKRYKSGKQLPLREVISRIENAGYRASGTQFGSSLIKTDCPWRVMDEIMGR